MPVPRKHPQELRDQAKRFMRGAMGQEVSLSLNATVIRIDHRAGVNPDTLRGWAEQARVDAGELRGVTFLRAGARVSDCRSSELHRRASGLLWGRAELSGVHRARSHDRPVGWRTESKIPTDPPLDALEMALWVRHRAGRHADLAREPFFDGLPAISGSPRAFRSWVGGHTVPPSTERPRLGSRARRPWLPRCGATLWRSLTGSCRLRCDLANALAERVKDHDFFPLRE